MIRLALHQLWGRRLQALAPLVALLVATVGFQAVLLSARVTQSHVQGVIAANWNPPYDLLVHPPGLMTGLRPGDQLAQPNFLDSVGGGITLTQVSTVRGVSGVSAAAPLGVVATDYLRGYDYAIDLSALPHPNDFNLYRVSTTYTTDGGLSTFSGVTEYVIVQGAHPPYQRSPLRVLEDGLLNVSGRIIECAGSQCFTDPSRFPPSTAGAPLTDANRAGDRFVYFKTGLTVPIVAVDPVAENALFGLNRCVTSGRSLRAGDPFTVPPAAGPNNPIGIPALLNAKPGFDEAMHVRVDMATSVAPVLAHYAAPFTPGRDGIHPYLVPTQIESLNLPYATVARKETSLSAEWAGAHGAGFLGGDLLVTAVDRTVNTLQQANFTGTSPRIAIQPPLLPSTKSFNAYNPQGGDYDEDAAVYADRALHSLDLLVSAGRQGTDGSPYHSFNVLGKYDPTCVSGSLQLSRGAFDIYANPDTTTPDNRHLGPHASMTGLATPMPMIMTNLTGGAYFSDQRRFTNGKGEAFISVIRAKVSGTDIPGPGSQKRLQQVAAEIHSRTGLAVDIIKGSSTETMSVSVPAGSFGRPALLVKQDWMHENVAIHYFQAINRTTVVLSVVVAVVAGLLTMQATYATVRRRRGELVLLRAIGWPSWRIAALMELEVVTLGGLVALIALIVAVALILLGRPGPTVAVGLLVAAPAAIAITALAGAGPALTASRIRPLGALRGPGRIRRHRRLLKRPLGLGIREALTTWRWQTLLGALATAVGAMFLGAVLGISQGFHASLDSTALAQELSSEVGPFDVLLGLLACVLGAATAVSVVLVATRERLPHFATLRALGWSQGQVGAVVAAQALTVGFLGGVLGTGALWLLANRVHTGITLTLGSQFSPLLLGLVTGIAAAAAALRLIYSRVTVSVIRVG